MEPVRNRGYRVVPMSDQDLDEVYEMRMLLEVPATLEAAERTPPSTTSLSSNHSPTTIEAAARDGEVVTFLDADRRFHLSLLTLCGNKRLVATVAALRDQTRLYGLDDLAERGVLADSASEHHEIVAAIRAKNASGLDTLIRAHLRHVRSDWAGAGEPPTKDTSSRRSPAV
jgi:DNA-binding GntR family transcriptional regulator